MDSNHRSPVGDIPFLETPVRAFRSALPRREEIGPAEKERPFRGAVPVAGGDTARAIAILGIPFWAAAEAARN